MAILIANGKGQGLGDFREQRKEAQGKKGPNSRSQKLLSDVQNTMEGQIIAWGNSTGVKEDAQVIRRWRTEEV